MRYHGMPRSVISAFIKICPICNLKQVQTSQPRIKPIRSDDFLKRFQIDLVDMRHNPCKKMGKNINGSFTLKIIFQNFILFGHWNINQPSK